VRVVSRPRRPPGRPTAAPSAREFDQAVSEFFMRLALREAHKGLGRTSPNPAVGAVLVKGGRVVARGHHARAGGPHAEIVALQQAGTRAAGADLYTTLEPCNHTGKTGPCTLAILDAGVRRVFVGSLDPFPQVSGRGVRRLRRGGVDVELGVLAEDTDRFNEAWFRFVRGGRPHVTVKVATTLDGRIATASGDARWITSEETRRRVHVLRDRSDAVLVGRGTVAADDPELTARIPGGKNPLRIVLDSSLSLPVDRRVFRELDGARTLVACTEAASHARRRRLERLGVEVLPCRARRGRVSLPDLLRRLHARGVVRLLVEGGAGVFGSFLEAGLVDRLLLHVGPRIAGAGPAWTSSPVARSMNAALRLELTSAELSGGDLLVEARPEDVR
jgi:diaminohydroxyphosphoribosylaminopyrimidine deaminase/5-amino-6-(5-phosphoribosylamino)uracil reductase